ncbi:DUF4960 domain-containing protein [Marinilabilia salmonicolor]|uniref:DUF4960 domain-containing protein n=1 Tax=Marinilabilia salmonicolor TaxID=989 RepID=UPI00029B18D9|nr:DUF4960 domain-containing protein [Marinilabilia salmonicolor]
MKRNIVASVMVFLLAGGLFTSCQEEWTASNLELDGEAQIMSFSVNGVEGEINEIDGEINVQVPDGTDLTSLNVEIDVPAGVEMSPEIGDVMDFSEPVSVRLVNGNVYNDYIINVTELFYIGFLSAHSSVATIEDDDEKAAAEWFFSNYENGEFVTFEEVQNGEADLSKYRVLWWYYDQSAELPGIALDNSVLSAVNGFYKGGGGLLLNSHACSYLWDLGRISSEFAMVIGSGEGFDNPDTWGIGVTLDAENGGWAHNVSNHPVYSGISMNVDDDGYMWFPVIGPGWKEDHNHVIENVPGYFGVGPNDNPEIYQAFTEELQAEWLGVWGGIRDYWMAGVVEFLPTEEYGGKAIYQGIGGFEFNQNALGELNPDGENPHHGNIQKFTKNAINYLARRN